MRVWIDDALVIDDWNAHYVTRTEGTIDLVAGVELPILVEYFELDIEASLRLESTPGRGTTVLVELPL